MQSAWLQITGAEHLEQIKTVTKQNLKEKINKNVERHTRLHS